MAHIIGDGKRKGRYNPNLGKEKSAEWKKAQRRDGLEKRLREQGPSDYQRLMERIEESSRPEVNTDFKMGLSRYDDFKIVYRSYREMPFSDAGEVAPAYVETLGGITANEIYDFASRKHSMGVGGEHWTSGPFLSNLIMGSWDKKFLVDFTEMDKDEEKMTHVGYRLKNKKLYVVGDVDVLLGMEAENCIFIVRGDVEGHVGMKAKNCKFFIDGEYKGHSDEIGKDCEVNVTENEPGWRQMFP